MMRAPYALILTMVLVIMLASSNVEAQSRGAPPNRARERVDHTATHAVSIADLNAWLQRLTGRFHLSRRGRFQGEEDCATIGHGSGVHCVIGPPPNVQTVSAPTMILYGLDPNTPGVRYLQVNGRSIAEGDLGTLSGDTVTFSKVSCPKSINQQARISIMTCEKRLKIYAPSHGKYILFQYITEQLVVVPTPSNGRRPRGQIATQLVTFTDDIQLQRVPAN